MATIDALVGELQGAGLEAASDVRDLNPPGVLVVPDAMVAPTKLCGYYSLRVTVSLVGRDSGDAAALDQVDQLWSTVSGVLRNRLTSDEALFTRRTAGDDATALPALDLTAVVRII